MRDEESTNERHETLTLRFAVDGRSVRRRRRCGGTGSGIFGSRCLGRTFGRTVGGLGCYSRLRRRGRAVSRVLSQWSRSTGRRRSGTARLTLSVVVRDTTNTITVNSPLVHAVSGLITILLVITSLDAIVTDITEEITELTLTRSLAFTALSPALLQVLAGTVSLESAVDSVEIIATASSAAKVVASNTVRVSDDIESLELVLFSVLLGSSEHLNGKQTNESVS